MCYCYFYVIHLNVTVGKNNFCIKSAGVAISIYFFFVFLLGSEAW